jgi:hypothetical protein
MDEIILSGENQNIREDIFLMFCGKAEGIVNSMRKDDGSWDEDKIAQWTAKLENSIITLSFPFTPRVQANIETFGTEEEQKALREASRKYRPKVAEQKKTETRYETMVKMLMANDEDLSREEAEEKVTALFLAGADSE